MNNKLYVQYGCGLSAPHGWVNFDASPTLRLQKIPLLGKLVRKTVFPSSVRYGDVTKKLPGIQLESCDGIYCSHVLEHLSLQDFEKALQNSYAYLKPGGIFRAVLPDLNFNIAEYIKNFEEGHDASRLFMESTMLGNKKRPKTLKEKFISSFGNSQHLWMWNEPDFKRALLKVGFREARRCIFNDSKDENFKVVEDEGRFYGAVAVEAIK